MGSGRNWTNQSGPSSELAKGTALTWGGCRRRLALTRVSLRSCPFFVSFFAYKLSIFCFEVDYFLCVFRNYFARRMPLSHVSVIRLAGAGVKKKNACRRRAAANEWRAEAERRRGVQCGGWRENFGIFCSKVGYFSTNFDVSFSTKKLPFFGGGGGARNSGQGQGGAPSPRGPSGLPRWRVKPEPSWPPIG